jgi:hypothetical protein
MPVVIVAGLPDRELRLRSALGQFLMPMSVDRIGVATFFTAWRFKILWGGPAVCGRACDKFGAVLSVGAFLRTGLWLMATPTSP